jgi:glycosyltransferase involved in cell wall biosynthesis
LESFAQTLRLPVDFLGFVNQKKISAIYASADCLVLPSNETWGLVVNEAFACRVPAIVARQAGCAPELITEGRTGWTLATPDEEELARLLELAIRDARRLQREEMGCTSPSGYEAGTKMLLEIVEGLHRPR